jgi:hypothetical protein
MHSMWLHGLLLLEIQQLHMASSPTSAKIIPIVYISNRYECSKAVCIKQRISHPTQQGYTATSNDANITSEFGSDWGSTI